jgi:hypothetical protein
MRLLAAPLLLLGYLGCGDPLADLGYLGDPLASVKGSIMLTTSQVPTHSLNVLVGWRAEKDPHDTWSAQPVSPSGGFPAAYRLDRLAPPPLDALSTDPDTGGKLGFAFIVLYEDVNENGYPDFDSSGKGLPSGPDQFRGGAELLMLAYAADPFGPQTRIAQDLGTELTVGYHLMRADASFRCIWDETIRDWHCPSARTQLEKVPFSTSVDLKAIDDPSQWSPVHAPDWLFLK